MSVVESLGNSRYDVAIIGGGHNGLVAGNYLARRGRRAIVIEAAPALGGMTTSGNFFPEAPDHVMHPGAVDVIMMNATSIARDLQLEQYGYQAVRPDPPYAYLHPDGTVVALWRDPVRTAESIRRFSPHDASAYLDFAELLTILSSIAGPGMSLQPSRPDLTNVSKVARGIIRGRKRLKDIIGFAAVSALQVVDERFTHPAVRSALIGMAASAGPVDKPGSSLSFLLLGFLHTSGITRPIGGMAALTDALSRGFTAHGGHISTGVPVEEIDFSGNDIRGVRLGNDTTISADAVLSTADPHTTLRSLLPEGVLDLKTTARVDHIPANGDGISPFKIDLALSSHVALPDHHLEGVDLRTPVLMLGTVEEVLDSFTVASKGQVPENPAMWVCVPTGADPTQGPPGQDSVYLYPLAMPLNPPIEWAQVSSTAEKATLAAASRFISGLEEFEISRLVETPPMLAERFRARHGCLVHVDFSLTRTGPLRPAWGLSGYTTPFDGLFLGGAGSHPGGGVSGLPGKHSSTRVDRYLKTRSGRNRR